jgi:2'-5' RNA ligase
VEGTLYYQDGGQAGSFTRTLRPNDGVVVNEFFEVNSELQGRGAGTKMMAEWEDSYARSGFHTMEVNASSGGNFNGAYVWARYGYTPSPGETARVAQKFLNSSQGSIDPPFMSGSDYVAKFGDSLLPGITSIRGFDKFLMTEDVAWNGTKSTNTLSKSIADAVKVINRWMRDNPAALEKDDVGFWKEVRDALKVTITKEDKASHGGAMISVPIPESLSQQIAVEGGTEPGDHHITLAFLTNDASTLSEEDRKNIESVMEAIGMLFGPSFGFLQQDYGTFEPGPNSEGMIPWWRKPVVRNLSEIRRVLVAGLEKHGIECSKNFRWTPHVTIDYLPEGQRPEEPRFTRRREYFNVDRIRFTADREAVDVSLHGAIR